MVKVGLPYSSRKLIIGMYANEEDVYGDEIDGDEDKNDGLNALVPNLMLNDFIESSMGDWY
jgi:hypothetical protein